MSNTVETYQGLVTWEFQDQPNFMAVVALGVAFPVQVQSLLASMIPLFDLGTPPVGDQLNILGDWVGIPRTSISANFDDSDYLTLILAKIAINTWDGTTDDIYAIYGLFFPNVQILISDNQDMSMSYLVSTALGDVSLVESMVTLGFFLKPEGVQLAAVIYAPIIDSFFGMTDALYFYLTGNTQPNASPFNTAQSYQTDWPWLDATMALGPEFIQTMTTEAGIGIITESGSAIELES